MSFGNASQLKNLDPQGNADAYSQIIHNRQHSNGMAGFCNEIEIYITIRNNRCDENTPLQHCYYANWYLQLQ